MTRVAVLDRHPAVRAGLRALLRRPAGARVRRAASRPRASCSPLLYRTDPDVLIVDRLEVVRRAKLEAPRTRVLLYVADPSPEFLLAAEIAGADGVIDKAADTRELLRARARRAGAAGGRRCASRRAPRRGWTRATARSSPCAWPARRRATSRASSGSTVAALNARVQAIVAQLAAPRAAAFA